MRLKAIRIAKGWSLAKLSRESGLSRQGISFIESGQKSPTLDTLTKLAQALDVSVAMLIEGDECDDEHSQAAV